MPERHLQPLQPPIVPLASRIETWHKVALAAFAIVVSIFSIGAGYTTIVSSKVDVVAQGKIDAVQDTAIAKIDEAEAVHEVRLANVERSVTWQQNVLFDLAVKSGLRPVAPPAPSPVPAAPPVKPAP